MAHGQDKRQAVRSAYIHDRVPLEKAAAVAGIAEGTARRWKRDARKNGDDWDKHRAACLLAGDGVEAIARQMLADYVSQHQLLMECITKSEELGPEKKVSMLASLADSFNKTVSASKRVLPETSELATALAVLSRLSDFVRGRYPQHAAAFLEILEPFGSELERVYG